MTAVFPLDEQHRRRPAKARINGNMEDVGNKFPKIPKIGTKIVSTSPAVFLETRCHKTETHNTCQHSRGDDSPQSIRSPPRQIRQRGVPPHGQIDQELGFFPARV